VTYTHVLLDLDGAVYVGDRAVPGAPDAIATLRSAGLRVGFVTNDPVSARGDYVERLAALGIPARAEELVTCAWAAAQLVAAEHPRARVLALGSEAWRDEHRDAGLRLVEDPAAAEVASVGGDRRFGYDDLRRAVRAVLWGAELYGSNRDATFPDAGGPSPAAGTLLAAVEYATGRVARCAGKPEPGMFREAMRLLGEGRYLMVGDRLDADVAGAASVGIDAALVLTGSSSEADVSAWRGAAPTHVLASLAALPALLDAVTCSGT
jgi:HAD superfamily hydrolase (TIGR01450 family)